MKDIITIVISCTLPIIVASIAGWFALVQIRRNNITNARLIWINEIKDRIANILKISSSLLIVNQIHLSEMDADDKIKFIGDIHTELKENLSTLYKELYMLSLNLNKAEFLSNALLLKIGECIGLQANVDKLEFLSEFTPVLKDILTISTSILKIEWEVTKKGKVKYMDQPSLETYKMISIEKAKIVLSKEQIGEIEKWTKYYEYISV